MSSFNSALTLTLLCILDLILLEEFKKVFKLRIPECILIVRSLFLNVRFNLRLFLL